jgi:hypothetical protein
MCWSANSSIASFIIGTIINISVMLYFKTPVIYSICILWQWVLMMQLSEYFIWKDLDNKSTNGIGTKMALIFNITQPLVGFLCLLLTSTATIGFKIIASIVILFYISYMIFNFNKQNEYKSLNPSTQCKHMNLKWWHDIKNSGLVYCVTLISIILLILRPFKLSIFFSLFLIITFIISFSFYSCGGASMWCWFVVPFPIFLSFFYLIK